MHAYCHSLRYCGRAALAAVLLLALQAAGSAQVLLYEPFNYAGAGPVNLTGTGATNTTGFDPTDRKSVV